MTRNLVILGASGNALDILDVVDAINATAPTWTVAGLLDDAERSDRSFAGLPILGGVGDARRLEGAWFINAIRQRGRVGTGALVGMGAVVLSDVEPGAVVVGNPARVLERPLTTRS